MLRHAHYVCLCLIVSVACADARVFYEDLSVPEDGIQGFSITQTSDSDDTDIWTDLTATTASSGSTAFSVQTEDVYQRVSAPRSVSSIVDTLLTSLFTPRQPPRDMYNLGPERTFPDPFVNELSGRDVGSSSGGRPWGSASASVPANWTQPSIGWPSNEQLTSVGPDDLFRQLSLARFSPQRYRLYLVPVIEDYSNEPSLEELLWELDQETAILSAQLDGAEPSFFPDNTISATFSDGDPMYYDSSYAYDTSYDSSYDPYGSLYEYDVVDDGLRFPSNDDYFASFAEANMDDVQVVYMNNPNRNAADDLPAVARGAQYYDTLADGDSRPSRSWGWGNEPRTPQQFSRPNPGYSYRSADGMLFGPHPPGFGFWTRLCESFNVWTVILAVACLSVWVYVFVEYFCHKDACVKRCVFGGKRGDLLDESSDSAKAPLLPLSGEFEGVEAADVYRAYALKVQHARDLADSHPESPTLKAFGP